MTKPNRRECRHFIVGVDIGLTMEPTAFAVVEQLVVDLHPYGRGRETRSLKLRHLERMPLDATYPRIVTRAEELVKALVDHEQDRRGWGKEPSTDLVINITGTGRHVGEAMSRVDLRPIMVTVTGGSGERHDPGRWQEWSIARNELIGQLLFAFQNDRFRVAKGMDLAGKFVEELQAFKLKRPALNPNDPEAWRERPDEDLVFAVALAAWRARRYQPKPPAQIDRENRGLEERRAELDAYFV